MSKLFFINFFFFLKYFYFSASFSSPPFLRFFFFFNSDKSRGKYLTNLFTRKIIFLNFLFSSPIWIFFVLSLSIFVFLFLPESPPFWFLLPLLSFHFFYFFVSFFFSVILNFLFFWYSRRLRAPLCSKCGTVHEKRKRERERVQCGTPHGAIYQRYRCYLGQIYTTLARYFYTKQKYIYTQASAMASTHALSFFFFFSLVEK